MPEFEEIVSITLDDFYNKKYRTENKSTDITGDRVEQYVNMVIISHILKIFCWIMPFWCDSCMFQFQNDDPHQSMMRLRVIERLMPINQNATNSRPSGWLLKVGDSFQQKSTKVWRNGGDIPEARDLLPPVRQYEEITKRGAGQNITSILLLRSILVPESQEGLAGNPHQIKLYEDYKSKWLMLVGDGLTKIRIKSFVEEINRSCYEFGQKQKA